MVKCRVSRESAYDEVIKEYRDPRIYWYKDQFPCLEEMRYISKSPESNYPKTLEVYAGSSRTSV